jgi:hypothetical protein
MTRAETRRRGEKGFDHTLSSSHQAVSPFRGFQTPIFLSFSASLRLCARSLLHGYGSDSSPIALSSPHLPFVPFVRFVVTPPQPPNHERQHPIGAPSLDAPEERESDKPPRPSAPQWLQPGKNLLDHPSRTM